MNTLKNTHKTELNMLRSKISALQAKALMEIFSNYLWNKHTQSCEGVHVDGCKCPFPSERDWNQDGGKTISMFRHFHICELNFCKVLYDDLFLDFRFRELDMTTKYPELSDKIHEYTKDQEVYILEQQQYFRFYQKICQKFNLNFKCFPE